MESSRGVHVVHMRSGDHVDIDDAGRIVCRTAYEARTDKELPVLARWVNEAQVSLMEAAFLDIILYSRDQIREEVAAMGGTDDGAGTSSSFTATNNASRPVRPCATRLGPYSPYTPTTPL